MTAADPHPRQAERLAALRATGLLDAPREADFEEVAALAARLCGTPIAVVNLVEEHRQFFLAETGLGVRETPLDTSLCAHVILRPGLTVIEDLRQDPAMERNPLVATAEGLRFYAGALLETAQGLPIGTLCVLDTRVRGLDPTQREALRVLARQVMRQIELRQALRSLSEAAAREEVLRREVDHRVKNSLQVVGSMLRLQAGRPDAGAALADAASRVEAIALLHAALHDAEEAGRVELSGFLARVGRMLAANLPAGVALEVAVAPLEVDGSVASACGLLVSELVTNAARHAFPHGQGGQVRVEGVAEPAGYRLSVSDDGVGFTPGKAGGGLGLAIADALAGQVGGVLSRPGTARGSRTELRLPPG
ncbi:sensor histidine kinase [Roseococcus sp. DSY-14]|uniref:sensor histidine kinase n=1 Tax=Roseococcus sp. DSY-14 TaxID=3369650 RepID=UPI00387ACAC6